MDDEIIRTSFDWQLHLNAPPPEGFESCYDSPTFFSGTDKRFQWSLQFSVKDKCWQHTSINIVLITSDANTIRVNYELSLERCANVTTRTSPVILQSTKGTKSFNFPNDCVAHVPRFMIPRLYKDLYNGYGYLFLLCRLEIHIVHGKCTIKYHNQGIPDFEKLLDDPEFSDLTLITPSKSFEVNRKILSSRSVVFRAMFEHDMKEKVESTVYIEDIDSEIIQELLRYIYCNRVECFDDPMQLFRAADKYQIDDLKLMCLEKLCDQITVGNAVEIYIFANSCDDKKSIDHAIDYIVDNIEEISASSRLDSLRDVDLLRRIFQKTVSRYIS
ncbi:hypothetical protein QAD02_008726 [Eretmocerus hayati]|uniref:Uncharacterized protein n=1 Tax=Eretmocerus hayati TaxID=131215 RepID=A0ACC2N7M6_9HYME|nr:hypothetical protein QAD02_008726 [Eretmocerus hayati]